MWILNHQSLTAKEYEWGHYFNGDGELDTWAQERHSNALDLLTWSYVNGNITSLTYQVEFFFVEEMKTYPKCFAQSLTYLRKHLRNVTSCFYQHGPFTNRKTESERLSTVTSKIMHVQRLIWHFWALPKDHEHIGVSIETQTPFLAQSTWWDSSMLKLSSIALGIHPIVLRINWGPYHAVIFKVFFPYIFQCSTDHAVLQIKSRASAGKACTLSF